jgi:ribosomal protein S12 methylthiotransferase
VPEEVKEERKARLMELQERISAERLAAKVGKSMTVLVDEVDDEGAVARGSADAPEIDGVVYVEGKNFTPGEFIKVTIIDSDAHDLWAELKQ